MNLNQAEKGPEAFARRLAHFLSCASVRAFVGHVIGFVLWAFGGWILNRVEP